MSIFLNKDSKVIVQGITGGEGTKHTALMLKAGTQVVGGVNARKAGTTVTHGDVELPVFGTVVEAIEKTGADVSIIFVPPAFAKDAMVEAIDAEIPLLVVITEGIPVQDSAEAMIAAIEELRRAVGQLSGGAALALEDSDTRMSRLGRAEITLGEFADLDESLRRLHLVTVDDVRELAADLAGRPLSVAAVGSVTDDTFAGLAP